MTKGECVQKLFGIVGTVVFLCVLRLAMGVFDFLPEFLFSFIALMFFIADAAAVRSIVVLRSASSKPRRTVSGSCRNTASERVIPARGSHLTNGAEDTMVYGHAA